MIKYPATPGSQCCLHTWRALKILLDFGPSLGLILKLQGWDYALIVLEALLVGPVCRPNGDPGPWCFPVMALHKPDAPMGYRKNCHFSSVLYPDQNSLEVCSIFFLTIPLQQLAVSSVSPYCPSFQPWWNPCVTLVRGCVTTATWVLSLPSICEVRFGGWGNRIRMRLDGETQSLSLSKGFDLFFLQEVL